jgi:NAD(P)-dependent dehydrogenase (short-subunit alcohol dehydrogenase family)
MSPERRTVMITGATGHLGRAVAETFAAQGAALVLLGRRADGLRRAFGAPGPGRLLLPTDLLDRPQVAAAVQAGVERFGRIDVLCNLAGGFRMGEPVHETGDAWDAMHDLNVRTLLNMVHAVVPHMLEQGHGWIVNVGAHGALRGEALKGAYGASKASVIRLTEAMAAELRDRGIHVNCVLPTILDTPDNRAAMPDADPARWVAPRDLAAVIAFLASDAARAVHGAALPVTGLV